MSSRRRSPPAALFRALPCPSTRRVGLLLGLAIFAILAVLSTISLLLARAWSLKGRPQMAKAWAPSTWRSVRGRGAAPFASSAWDAAAAGCDLEALIGADAAAPAPLTLTWHAPPGAYMLFAYGPQEYVSSFSPPGSATFFEQHVSDFLVRALRAVAARQPTRLVWFLDVGANIGVHTGAVATAGFPVLAVEGFPTTAARLACSRLVNRWVEVTVAPFAIASSTRQVCFAVRHKNNQGMNWLNADANALTDCPAGYLVQARTLSDIVEAYAPSDISPAVVKLDIEGSELTCLQSFARHLSGSFQRHNDAHQKLADGKLLWQPELFIAELRPQLLAAHSESIPDVIAFMRSFGYRTFFADGSQELTHFGSRDEIDPAALAVTFNTTTCPNFVFTREDTVLSDDVVFHKQGCTDD